MIIFFETAFTLSQEIAQFPLKILMQIYITPVNFFGSWLNSGERAAGSTYFFKSKTVCVAICRLQNFLGGKSFAALYVVSYNWFFKMFQGID